MGHVKEATSGIDNIKPWQRLATTLQCDNGSHLTGGMQYKRLCAVAGVWLQHSRN